MNGIQIIEDVVKRFLMEAKQELAGEGEKIVEAIKDAILPELETLIAQKIESTIDAKLEALVARIKALETPAQIQVLQNASPQPPNPPAA
jgi:hypothetical protein